MSCKTDKENVAVDLQMILAFEYDILEDVFQEWMKTVLADLKHHPIEFDEYGISFGVGQEEMEHLRERFKQKRTEMGR